MRLYSICLSVSDISLSMKSSRSICVVTNGSISFFCMAKLYSDTHTHSHTECTHTYMSQAGLKLNAQKMKIMASSPMTSWQTDGEIMERVMGFIFLGSKITADGDCCH